MKRENMTMKQQTANEKQPLVSIVTPSYNQGQFIEDTIQSVKNQNYPNIEHIIVDGESTDNTLDIIKKYEGTYNMRWSSEPDEGPADACNKGFQQSKGEVFAYLNSDDLLLPDAVEKSIHHLIKTPSLDVVYGDAYIINAENRVLRKMYSTTFFNPYLYVLGGFGIAQQATFWRRDMFEAVDGFNPKNRTCWDAEMWVDMALHGAKFRYINQFLAAFRYHSSSITISRKFASEYKKDRERIFKKVFGRFPTVWDRYLLMSISKILGKLIPPQKLFPTFGIKNQTVIDSGEMISNR